MGGLLFCGLILGQCIVGCTGGMTMSYRIRYGKRKNNWLWWAAVIGVVMVWLASHQYDALARFVGGKILGSC